jgi:hypothetical protein
MASRGQKGRRHWGGMLVRLLPQVKGLPGGLIVTTSDGKKHQPLDELTIASDHLTYRQENGITLTIVPFEQIAWIELTNLSHPVR